MSHKNNRGKCKGAEVQPRHPILRLFVFFAGSGIAISATYGFYKVVGVVEPLDKLIVSIFALSAVIYYALDIKDKFTKWEL